MEKSHSPKNDVVHYAGEERELPINPGNGDVFDIFCDNRVVTSKYTIFTFLPKFLLEAFSKFANFYFLLVTILQLVPAVTTTNGIPYNALPLSLVLSMEALASILEDRQRHRDDDLANSSIATIVDSQGNVKKLPWRSVRVGDILLLRNRESIPADCLILASSDKPATGVCYVETKSLDGETNLKLHQGIEDVARKVEAMVEKLRSEIPGPKPDAPVEQLDKYEIKLHNKAILQLRGLVKSEKVNNHIHQYSGAAIIYANDEERPEDFTPLSITNMLLRGCVLRNTDFAYAMVINTGHETKIMQNSHTTRGKLSLLDRVINKNIILFVVAELALCLVAAFLSSQWSEETGEVSEYLELEPFDSGDFVARVGTFFLLVANVIPISLYVMMKFSRFFQSYFVRWDLDMVFDGEDPNTGERLVVPAKVRTMDLNDSLGEVNYIFSDKTGTLTNNVMEFRKCSVGGVVYGTGTTVIGAASLERRGDHEAAQMAKQQIAETAKDPHPRYVNFQDSHDSKNSLATVLTQGASPQRKKFMEFSTALALCHSVLLERVKDDNGAYTGEVRLSAASPDDQALVAVAKEFGVSFEGRADGGKVVNLLVGAPSEYLTKSSPDSAATAAKRASTRGATPVNYQLLETLEFTSKRKRMSVIVKSPEGRIELISKGADSEIFKRINRGPGHDNLIAKTSKDLLEFANDGLRTLALGSKVLSEQEFQAWHAKYKEAVSDIIEQEKMKNKEPNDIDELMDEMEVGLNLLGATAIEDKLQDGVPAAIHNLSQGGIKIWVLTGDKEETAINIGYACLLLDNEMQQMTINESSGSSAAEIHKVLERFDKDTRGRTVDDGGQELALIIDGHALGLAVAGGNAELLLRIAARCKAVIACRTSPKQKSIMVDLVKKYEKWSKTLAIGDGANDVSMIQTAHIGIGISGQEGLQAVNSSDYAIAQFRYLERLLFVHGRSNYRRMSYLVLYMFYKNVFLILSQLWWTIFTGYSGQKFYLEFAIQFFNVTYSALPIFLFAIYDVDLPDKVVLANPQLYELGRKGSLFNLRKFWGSVVNGLYHSIIGFLIVYFCFDPTESQDLWMLGALMFTIVVVVINFNYALVQAKWHWTNQGAFILTIALWPIMALVFEHPFFLESFTTDFGRDWNGIFTAVFSRYDAWLSLALATVCCSGMDFLLKSVQRNWFPNSADIIQEQYLLGARKRSSTMKKAEMVKTSINVVVDKKESNELVPSFDITISDTF